MARWKGRRRREDGSEGPVRGCIVDDRKRTAAELPPFLIDAACLRQRLGSFRWVTFIGTRHADG